MVPMRSACVGGVGIVHSIPAKRVSVLLLYIYFEAQCSVYQYPQINYKPPSSVPMPMQAMARLTAARA
jgi:hypothetical protein